MTQKSPIKHVLLHTIENHVGSDAEQIQLNRDIGTNTPNYAEEIAGAFDNGNAVQEIVQGRQNSKLNIE